MPRAAGTCLLPELIESDTKYLWAFLLSLKLTLASLKTSGICDSDFNLGKKKGIMFGVITTGYFHADRPEVLIFIT